MASLAAAQIRQTRRTLKVDDVDDGRRFAHQIASVGKSVNTRDSGRGRKYGFPASLDRPKSNDRAGTRVERLASNLAAARKTQKQHRGSDVFGLGDPMEQVLQRTA